MRCCGRDAAQRDGCEIKWVNEPLTFDVYQERMSPEEVGIPAMAGRLGQW